MSQENVQVPLHRALEGTGQSHKQMFSSGAAGQATSRVGR
jgi:hypothetical protein